MRIPNKVINLYGSILAGAKQGVALGNDDLDHLTNPLAARNYLRFALTVAAEARDGKVLDWGCGYGQMTLLLEALGVDVEAFEVERRPNIERISPFRDVDITYGEIGDPLPYKPGTFDTVISCGTLEHVSSQEEALQELVRVLKPGGSLYIFMLPNKWSYTEKLASILLGRGHERKFTFRSIRDLLEQADFKPVRMSYANAIPHNLSGLPRSVGAIYGRLAPLLDPIDRILSKTPVINRICGVLEIVAVKKAT